MQSKLIPLLAVSTLFAANADASAFSFSTGGPDYRIATGAQAGGTSREIESADDFVLTQHTQLNQATFTGLLANGATLSDIANVNVEIYRVFGKDSVNPPSGRVPTRVNSPSDVAFLGRESADNSLSYSVTLLNSNALAGNSVINGIHPLPNQTTGGEGAVSGQEVRFDINFNDAISLAADHYFFVPQVELKNGNFLWLSAAKPIVGGSGPFTPDLQSWIRDGNLDPDWLRIGTDIVGGTTFNQAFSVSGVAAVPLPAATWLFLSGILGVMGLGKRKTAGA
ncbi:PEP-CTERM sorting domain-containing protein [Methylomonas sp. EFPC1]|uniref:PEP-CTERM sorting domain-containing protein n=1 Tax=Methylomonas sp. EFPC1 TaxID=2812647 RepID=UPI001967CB8D|nr:PEP-CTERM sorting domain-containing protein [Methylomonas sp. EFPC1]QSB00312.1 PEP-CTERM sorting domain-containing protein [Methylomonas sp. EFPC1]